MATTMGIDTTANDSLLLAGDIGGTNTRLSLYDREQCSSSDCSRYNSPLFAKEYRNEETVGALKSEINTKVNGCDNSESCDKNVQNFVRSIVAPFLEEAWESDALVARRNQNESEEKACIFACFAIAGPVDPSRNNGTVTTSQRQYLIGVNGEGIAKFCQQQMSNLPAVVKTCVVINDFVAQGYGCLSLSTGLGELYPLYDRASGSSPSGPKFCVGAGTGFGSCYMVPSVSTASEVDNPNSVEYTCFPSEYGQSDWAPSVSFNINAENPNEEDDPMRIWTYLKEKNKTKRNPHIAVEDIVSGVGLATAYECLSGLFPALANKSIREKFQSESDFRGKVVGEHVSDCVICKRAVESLLRAYGSVVGSCAMSFLPTGGLYITGGLLMNLVHQEISARYSTAPTTSGSSCSPETKSKDNSDVDKELLPIFLNSYRSKGAASFLLNDIPLYIVLAKDTGLRGAAIRAGMVRFE